MTLQSSKPSFFIENLLQLSSPGRLHLDKVSNENHINAQSCPEPLKYTDTHTAIYCHDGVVSSDRTCYCCVPIEHREIFINGSDGVKKRQTSVHGDPHIGMHCNHACTLYYTSYQQPWTEPSAGQYVVSSIFDCEHSLVSDFQQEPFMTQIVGCGTFKDDMPAHFRRFEIMKGSSSRRDRTSFSYWQRYHLESHFRISRYPTRLQRMELANALDLSEVQVKVWFQNKRMKVKKWRNVEPTERGLLMKRSMPCRRFHCKIPENM